jgi:hypothetical protein
MPKTQLMKNISGILLLAIMTLMFACTKPANEEGHSPSEWKEEALMIDLNTCESVTFGNEELTLCLNSVADSRCPVDATCIWSGTAITELTFKRKGQEHNFSLAIPPFASYRQEMNISGYTIKLINVYPHPQTGINVPAGQVKAKLEIRNY